MLIALESPFITLSIQSLSTISCGRITREVFFCVGRADKKAPVERRERRKRDNPQGQDCFVGYFYNTIFCQLCQVLYFPKRITLSDKL
jgi:hypothetical protein